MQHGSYRNNCQSFRPLTLLCPPKDALVPADPDGLTIPQLD